MQLIINKKLLANKRDSQSPTARPNVGDLAYSHLPHVVELLYLAAFLCLLLATQQRATTFKRGRLRAALIDHSVFSHEKHLMRTLFRNAPG